MRTQGWIVFPENKSRQRRTKWSDEGIKLKKKKKKKKEGEEVSVIPLLFSLPSFFPLSCFSRVSFIAAKATCGGKSSIQLLADAISVGGKSNTPPLLREKWNVESKEGRGGEQRLRNRVKLSFLAVNDRTLHESLFDSLVLPFFVFLFRFSLIGSNRRVLISWNETFGRIQEHVEQ